MKSIILGTADDAQVYPPIPLLQLASSFADNNPVAPPPHLATQ